jgi:uncharacterized integral membrane protein (TIGR00698 family)
MPAPTAERTDAATSLTRLVPGVLFALAGAALGIALHELLAVLSALVVAVVIGMVAGNTGLIVPGMRPGLAFAGRHLLRAGVVVVGFRLSAGDLGDLGWPGAIAVMVTVSVTFFGMQWLGRKLGVPPGLSLLAATGFSICGASAIAAAEPLSDADRDEVAYALGLVALCGTLAIFVLPPLGNLLDLSPILFGKWAGASVHDVGQVVATASLRGDEALAAAVVVKLTRVALLAPLLAVVAVGVRRRAGGDSTVARPPLLPLFIVLFLVAVAVRTTGVLSDGVLDHLRTLEALLLGAGLVALGCGVDLRRLRRLGGRPLVLGMLSWVLMSAVALGTMALVT